MNQVTSNTYLEIQEATFNQKLNDKWFRGNKTKLKMLLEVRMKIKKKNLLKLKAKLKEQPPPTHTHISKPLFNNCHGVVPEGLRMEL